MSLESCNTSLASVGILPENKNLHWIDRNDYQGMPLMEGHGPYIVEYLDRLIEVLKRALMEHPRSLAIRCELKFPIDGIDLKQFNWTGLMKRFTQSLQAKINADRERARSRCGGRCHESSLRYVWAREVSSWERDHFHVLLLVNHDAYRNLGSFESDMPSLANMIRAAWASALRMDLEGQRYVHFPENPVYFINGRLDSTTFAEVFRRASYFCKVRTKVYGNRQQSFGYSRR